MPSPPPAAVAPSEPTGIPAGYVDLHATRVEQLDEANARVLLEGDGSRFVVPVYIGVLEGNAIGLRRRGEQAVRPNTADRLDPVSRELHGTGGKVPIDDHQDNT